MNINISVYLFRCVCFEISKETRNFFTQLCLPISYVDTIVLGFFNGDFLYCWFTHDDLFIMYNHSICYKSVICRLLYYKLFLCIERIFSIKTLLPIYHLHLLFHHQFLKPLVLVLFYMVLDLGLVLMTSKLIFVRKGCSGKLNISMINSI